MFTRLMSSLVGLLALVTVASAHFHLQYPIPRGPFNMANEVNFCDSYTDAVDNRTSFPLDNGFITLTSEHPQWTAAVLISIDQDPTNFTVFNISSSGVHLPLAVPFFSASGEGAFCIPIDIGALNIPGVTSGTNVTIQVEYNGGDGNLFQCADLTLFSNASIPSSVNCTNVVGNGTSTSSSPSATTTNGASPKNVGTSLLLGAVAFLFSIL